MNFASLNLILLPLLLLLIVIVIKFILPIISTRMGGLITWKRSFILAGIYVGVLILLVPLLTMLPDKGFIKPIDNNSQTSILSQSIISDLKYNFIRTNSNLDNQPGIFKISSHTFKTASNRLFFNLQFNGGNRQIIIKRKDIDDGEIEISIYTTTQLVGGIDFARLILPPGISLQKETLSIMAASPQRLDFKQFKADILMDQFKTQNSGNYMGRVIFGIQIIYIRVPKSLEINEGKYANQIQMLNSN